MKLLFTFFSALILFQSLLAGKITWNEKDEATVQSGSGLGVPAEGVTWPTSGKEGSCRFVAAPRCFARHDLTYRLYYS